jgi:hypothetical protein
MTAYLAPFFDPKCNDPSKRQTFFNVDDEKSVRDFINSRECLEPGWPPKCTVNLSFGFFFDGTNNNLKRDRKTNSQSNVARLFEAFPGGADRNDSAPWPQLKTKYHNSFFRTYIPGVGTPFDEVKDSGKGFNLTDDRPKGLAFCYLGENRIVWALVEAINNVHRYYKDSDLIDQTAFQDKFNRLTLPRYMDRNERSNTPYGVEPYYDTPVERFVNAFSDAIRDLHKSLNAYVPVGTGKVMDHGEVLNIYTSIFGFSRGAAEARAFSNWFVWLCKLDAQIAGKDDSALTLGTIPVNIDFLGLFDTVASVGFAATLSLADGHQAWADAESSLKIPSEPKECLHIVSGHEIRRSFPLDSVADRGTVPTNCKEMVFPGVHSDIGGGYPPLDQGRGKDKEGTDMVSRITLAEMYRAARLAGVPLKLEEAPDSVKRAFKIAPSVIEKFNAYINETNRLFKNPIGEDGKPKPLPLQDLMAQQHQLYILWRKKMIGKMSKLPNINNPSVSDFDKTDIAESDKEFAKEIENFNKWIEWKKHPEARVTGPEGSLTRPPEPFHDPEWDAIEKFWHAPEPLPAITDFLELFAHDSRAWFKPFGKDIPDLLNALDDLVAQGERAIEWDAQHAYQVNDFELQNPYRLTKAQQDKVTRYKAVKGTPEQLKVIDPDTKGREPYDNSIPFIVPGGYLRYRRIYMGSDSYKPAGAQYAGLSPKRTERIEKTLPETAMA